MDIIQLIIEYLPTAIQYFLQLFTLLITVVVFIHKIRSLFCWKMVWNWVEKHFQLVWESKFGGKQINLELFGE